MLRLLRKVNGSLNHLHGIQRPQKCIYAKLVVTSLLCSRSDGLNIQCHYFKRNQLLLTVKITDWEINSYANCTLRCFTCIRSKIKVWIDSVVQKLIYLCQDRLHRTRHEMNVRIRVAWNYVTFKLKWYS